MRKLILTALLIGALLVVASAGTASASVKWPARCTNFKCVNAHLNALHTSQKKATANFNGFLNCLDLWDVTQYGNFLLDDGVTSVTGLDYTGSGDSIDTWMLGIDGGVCGFPSVAAVTPHVKTGEPVPLLRFYRP